MLRHGTRSAGKDLRLCKDFDVVALLETPVLVLAGGRVTFDGIGDGDGDGDGDGCKVVVAD